MVTDGEVFVRDTGNETAAEGLRLNDGQTSFVAIKEKVEIDNVGHLVKDGEIRIRGHDCHEILVNLC